MASGAVSSFTSVMAAPVKIYQEMETGAFPMAQQVKYPPAMQKTQEMQVRSLGQEEPLKEEMATHSNILA